MNFISPRKGNAQTTKVFNFHDQHGEVLNPFSLLFTLNLVVIHFVAKTQRKRIEWRKVNASMRNETFSYTAIFEASAFCFSDRESKWMFRVDNDKYYLHLKQIDCWADDKEVVQYYFAFAAKNGWPQPWSGFISSPFLRKSSRHFPHLCSLYWQLWLLCKYKTHEFHIPQFCGRGFAFEYHWSSE